MILVGIKWIYGAHLYFSFFFFTSQQTQEAYLALMQHDANETKGITLDVQLMFYSCNLSFLSFHRE